VSVWLCIPSKRPPEQANEVLKLWRERGYKIALHLDDPPANSPLIYDYYAYELSGDSQYPGYAVVVNGLVHDVLALDQGCEWLVTGGDDVEPDPNHTAEEIAAECSACFGIKTLMHRLSCAEEFAKGCPDQSARTFGVMQPTGDRWGSTDPWAQKLPPNRRAYIDRVCGSPWMGREFCRRMYGGAGPLFPGYRHMFVDEELQAVAEKLGVLWQRPDLTHRHNHWGRGPNVQTSDCPEFLRAVSGPEHWKEASALFQSRKAAGFPGHEPLVTA